MAARIELLVLACVFAGGCSPEKKADANSALGASASHPVESTKNVNDGPFGIAMAGAIDDVPGAEPFDKPGLFKVGNPPKSHPDFESVVLVAYPDTGICQIRGIGRDLANDGSGSLIQSKIDSLSDALTTKYGKPETIDGCSGGDIACDSQFWMMTLLGGDRVYGRKWTLPNDMMKRNKVSEIYLVGNASDIQTSYPILEFHSADKSACKKAEQASSASVL
jgi:hypothetical protein